MLVAHGVTPLVWDVDEARRAFVAERLGARVAASAEEALACEVVITVTPGADVLYAEGSLEAGQHVSLMGADGPGKAEVAIEELRRAHLFCDDWEQASHGGELAAAVAAGVGRPQTTSPSSARCSSARPTGAGAPATSRSSTRPGSRSRTSRSRRSPTRRRDELDLQTIEL